MSVENRPPRLENLDNSSSRRRLGDEEDANGRDDASGSASPVGPPDLADSDSDSDELPDVMTASYSEICLDEDDDDGDLLPGEISDLAEVQDATQGINQLVDQINREEGNNSQSRPQTLGFRSPSGHRTPRHRPTSDSQGTSPCSSMLSSEDVLEDAPPMHGRYGSQASGLSDLHGTLTYEGDMVNFVAEDLQEKIKLSSPVTKVPEGGLPSFPTSRSSTPSLYKQLLTPQLGLVDPTVLADLEGEARAVAASVDSLLQSLSTNMHSISSMTIDCIRLYERGMCKTCDVADSNIKAMYQLMAKHEEVSNSMKPLYSLANQVKNIKKLLDHFENAVEGKT